MTKSKYCTVDKVEFPYDYMYCPYCGGKNSTVEG